MQANLVQETKDSLIAKFNRYAVKNNIEISIDNFFTYLNNTKVIRDKSIIKYRIAEMYPAILKECKGVKEDALIKIEAMTGVKYDSVMYIINKGYKEFL